MKILLLLLLIAPVELWAQANELKPIGNDLIPSYSGGGYGYGQSVRTQYTYDGLDIKPKALEPYIMASGNPDAIREFEKYIRNRHTGGWLIAGGIGAMVVGTAIALSNGPGSNGKFTTQQPIVCPVGSICSGSLGTVYGGQVAGYQTVSDTKRANINATGLGILIGGGILTAIGWSLNMPGQHVRRSVQYYNRALKQQGVSWQLSPYSTAGNSGLGLVGRF